MEFIKNEKPIVGFKCFNSGIITKYGKKMELDKMYELPYNPQFSKTGYHMCKNMEDTLRYFDAFNNEVDICIAHGYPNIDEYRDDYYGYYDMYSCQKIVLKEILSRKEIIELADKMCNIQFTRFTQGYKLTSDELDYFMNKYKNDINMIRHLIYIYYDKNIYSQPFNESELIKKYIKREYIV